MGDVFKAPCFIYFMILCVFILTQSYVLHERSTFILYALGSVSQSLRLYLVRHTRFVIRVAFNHAFSLSFEQAHRLYPHTFFYQLFFNVVIVNSVLRHRIGIYTTPHSRELARHSNLFMDLRLLSF